VKEPERQRSRSQAAGSPDSAGFLCPPTRPGASEPVSRLSFIHFDTQDGLILSAAAIERVVAPASYRATALSRRSSE
jgi:hypothetical protein